MTDLIVVVVVTRWWSFGFLREFTVGSRHLMEKPYISLFYHEEANDSMEKQQVLCMYT